ncbi:unnamed protein product [Didymodactylos carnosus]|uniref:Transmembrane protein n=1 Tax=Didymodactylos carnosus TaxID=1234261 RepID=A0A814SAR9_9BILA|nr:unnamed protein product [Didymodactylos carnosus]CAF1455227.1 unnamed protein product [Didymodactylos carnosus]CAF3908510.1 unnamed protein product [Didymodactylos carnosus]CAF4249326.1 unnamed protein product [Didymodactylos carnosus]
MLTILIFVLLFNHNTILTQTVLKTNLKVHINTNYQPSQPRMFISIVAIYPHRQFVPWKLCAIICNKHISCRTAVVNLSNQLCTLYRENWYVGTLIPQQLNYTVLALNYCQYPNTEPAYICGVNIQMPFNQYTNTLQLIQEVSSQICVGISIFNEIAYYQAPSYVYATQLQGQKVSTPIWIKSLSAYSNLINLRTDAFGYPYSVTSQSTSRIIELDILSSGNILMTYVVSQLLATPIDDVAIYNGSLWVNSYTNGYVSVINQMTSNTSYVYNLPGLSSGKRTLTYFDDHFWTTAQGTIYKWYANNNTVSIWNTTLPSSVMCTNIVQDYAGRRYVCNSNQMPSLYILDQYGEILGTYNKSLCTLLFDIYYTKYNSYYITSVVNLSNYVSFYGAPL